MTKQAHFGFQPVEEQAKQGMVNAVFERVAARYDVMNDVMSLGMHRLWKRRMVDALALTPNMTLLDLAGGTGDIATLAKQRTADLRVTLCDINPAMLAEGKKRMVDKNLVQGVEWVCGNAEALPFEANQFDRCSIAFGIRNVTHIDAALAEIFRVLKPGGKFVCLEFSHVALPTLAPIYDAYSFKVIPKLGGLIANDEASYRYLVESIRQFPPQEKFATMLKNAGFSRVDYRNLTGGVVALHTGVKL
jgi:demethylmenaquinone methyltransferase / 2-methoxy-6-polyprenyl-1,4-benzoquinol methylase